MARSDEAVLIDPLSYDPAKHGPPYVPVRHQEATDWPKVASGLKTAVKAMVDHEAATVGMEIEQLVQHFVTDYGGAPAAELAVLLAALRAEGMIHQAHHWATKGPTFYADHLLFDRAYSEVFGMVDGLAERAVGSGVTILVQPLLQVHHISGFSKSFYRDALAQPPPEVLPILSLRTTLRFLVTLNLVYASMEQRGSLSHGTDNLIQDMADNHEKLVYLFKQRAGADEVRTASTKVSPQHPAWKTRLPPNPHGDQNGSFRTQARCGPRCWYDEPRLCSHDERGQDGHEAHP